MTENKLLKGGVFFALSSIATLSYHYMNDNKKYKKRMKPIKEENYMPPTPFNTPNNKPEQKSNNLEIFSEDDSPLLNNKTIIKECIENIIEDVYEKTDDSDDKPEKSETHTFSSFLELKGTNSMTGTEELEFTKLENYPINNTDTIYGTDGTNSPPDFKLLKLINRDCFSEFDYISDKSEDIEHSYSDSELLKNSKKNNRKSLYKFLRKIKL